MLEKMVIFLIPALVTFLGYMFIKNKPKEINYVIGYRTKLSMKNQDTWDFAHQFCGKIWIVMGLTLLLATCLVVFISLSMENSLLIQIFCGIQLACVLSTLFFVESALKKNFDEDGNKISK